MKINSSELKRIMADYEFKHDIFSEDNERTAKAKMALEQLPQADRIIFTLFADYGSAKKVADIIGIGQTLMYKEIRRIRAEIERIYKIINLNDTDYE